MPTYNVELTLLEEMLGTCPANPDIYWEFVESKRPRDADADEDEAATLPPLDEQIAKGRTVFRRTPDGKPALMNYMLKGLFKDACGMLRRADDTESKKLKAYKKEIDGLVFITPRLIPIELPPGAVIGDNTRPLRAQTAQGERVSLASSETVPAGSIIRFQVKLLAARLEDAMHEWLEYGANRGLGQWRNAGFGSYSYVIEKLNTPR